MDVLGDSSEGVEGEGEVNDVAAKHPERVQAMAAELEAFLKETGAKSPKPWQGYNPGMAGQNRKQAERAKAQREKEQADMLKEGWKPNGDWWSSSKGTP